jgi:CheY-like chemotaxis protein
MGRTVDHSEDFVVDMVIEVGSRGTDVDALARRLILPGLEVLRTTGGGLIWFSALVTADGESAAIRQVQDAALSELDGRAVVVAATVIAGAPLGDLPSRLDAVLCDLEPHRMDLIDLVQAARWDRPVSLPDRAVRSTQLSGTG